MIWKQRLPSMLFNSHSLRIQVGHFDDTPCYSIASHRIQVGHFDDTILRLPLLGEEDTKNAES